MNYYESLTPDQQARFDIALAKVCEAFDNAFQFYLDTAGCTHPDAPDTDKEEREALEAARDQAEMEFSQLKDAFEEENRMETEAAEHELRQLQKEER